MSRLVRLAHLRLVDAAPLIAARELRMAEAEGIELELHVAPSWSALRDMLTMRRVDAAQMLSPMPVAMALGLGGAAGSVEALSVLSVNGDVIGVSHALAERMGEAPFGDARAMGAALVAAAGAAPIRIGVPFPFSMHAELVHYWLERAGPPPEGAIEIRTIPPAAMADAVSAGEVDAFCVGEPWGSIAVERGAGILALPGSAIWAFAPEKVLAARAGWAEGDAATAGALMRAVFRAQRWLAAPANRSTAAELLSRPDAIGVPAEIAERALSGRLVTAPGTGGRQVEGFLAFHEGAASFPWRSQGAWIADRLAQRHGLPRAEAQAAGRRVFRSDLYRRHLGALATDMPGASQKLEGAVSAPTPAPSQRGTLTLVRDAFFDGAIFEPLPGS